MLQISDADFGDLINKSLESMAPKYKERLSNVAFLLEDQPSQKQRLNLRLAPNQTLLGLYEGVPLPRRGGTTKLLPDKITLFKGPLLASSADLAQLEENIHHTIWHEVAHYFGLDHKRIHELDGNA